tara:strand:+ start:236 stop:895 length:660 start_codon:yes stop_codon:yes gene_type:complete
MMKNILKITCAVIAFSMTTQYYSQATFGVRAGLNLAKLSGKNFDIDGLDIKTLPSFNLGLITELGVSESFFVESGLYISGKGTKAEIDLGVGIGKTTQTFSALYLEIPLNASFKADLGGAMLNVFAGPYFAIALSGKNKIENPSALSSLDSEEDLKFGTDVADDAKRTDFGLNFGAGVQFESIVVRAQYGLGLTNLDPEGDSDFEMKNGVIGISLGYMF